MTDPMGNSTTYGYDERGNMTVTTDANGHSTTYTYDAAGADDLYDNCQWRHLELQV